VTIIWRRRVLSFKDFFPHIAQVRTIGGEADTSLISSHRMYGVTARTIPQRDPRCRLLFGRTSLQIGSAARACGRSK
jgi:hypothetical protein